jgi:hypothetical protein
VNLYFDGDRIGRFGANFVGVAQGWLLSTYPGRMLAVRPKPDRVIAEWNRQRAAPNAARVAKRHILTTLLRHARQCRD